MFALLVGSTAAFLAVLILIGAYTATRREGGSDYFSSDAVKLTAVIVVALLSALPTEILSIIWLTLLQDHVDATGNLFLLVIAPAVAAIGRSRSSLLRSISASTRLRMHSGSAGCLTRRAISPATLQSSSSLARWSWHWLRGSSGTVLYEPILAKTWLRCRANFKSPAVIS